MSSWPDTATTTEPREETLTRRVPPYNVILENDDHHSFEFVIEVLRKALGYSAERAFQLTEQAHHTGRAVVWTGPREVAELKADRLPPFTNHALTGPSSGHSAARSNQLLADESTKNTRPR